MQYDSVRYTYVVAISKSETLLKFTTAGERRLCGILVGIPLETSGSVMFVVSTQSRLINYRSIRRGHSIVNTLRRLTMRMEPGGDGII